MRRRPRPRSSAPAAHGESTARVAARPIRTACLLGLLCFVVYLTNLRPMAAGDSIPARLLPFSILREGNLDLNEFPWLWRLNPTPDFMHHASDGRWLSDYPITTPVLVTPLWVPVVWWLHRANIADADVRFRLVSVVMERFSAALIAAVSVSLLWLAASTLTSPGMAMGVALAYAFGTNTWATSSQALWQHGLAELALAGMSVSLLSPATRRHAIAAGGCAALAVLARPTMAIFAMLALLFMWRERRGQMSLFVILPIIGSMLLLAHEVQIMSGSGAAFRRATFVAPTLASLGGLLLSPSRGLLVYTPAVLLTLVGVSYPQPAARRWLRHLAVGIAGYLLLYSSWSGWWGGHCYGPRLLVDALPAMALCAVPALERLWQTRAARPVLLALAAWGVTIQVIGVYYDDRSWDALPRSVDVDPARLWDWGDPQIVRAAHAGWHGAELAPLLWQALSDPRPAFLTPLSPAQLAGGIVTEQPLPLHYPRRSSGALRVTITNRADITWPAFSDYGMLEVALVHSWWSNGTMVPGVGGLLRLPRNLGPGESLQTRLRLETPLSAGNYDLDISIVQSLAIDHGITGGAALRLPVHIE